MKKAIINNPEIDLLIIKIENKPLIRIKDQWKVYPIINTISYSHSKSLIRMLKEEPKSIPVQI